MLTIKSVPLAWQVGFQDAVSPIMEELIQLHDHIMFFLTMIVTFVFFMLFHSIRRFTDRLVPHKYMTHGVVIEVIWTLTPALILLSISFPSFQLLYLMDEVLDPAITLKAIGHQWYWSYEYSDYTDTISFDSYMIPTEDLPEGGLRLLEVDNKVVLPINTHVRVIVTAADVLHAWALPSLGVKIDAVPGRLNQTSFIMKREGTFYGQCSELCGFGHAFMPIVVEGVSLGGYLDWLRTHGNA